MKIQLTGTTRMLGNTPEEIIEGMLEMGYMEPSVTEPEAYLAYVEQQAAERFQFKVNENLSFDARCERVISALSDAGELDILED